MPTSQNSPAPSLQKCLLIFQNVSFKDKGISTLDQFFNGKMELTYATSIQEGIELIESENRSFDLILFEYKGNSQTMVKALLELGKTAKHIMITLEKTAHQNLKAQHPNFEILTQEEAPTKLSETLGKFFQASDPLSQKNTNREYVKVRAALLLAKSPLIADVYAKLREDHYIKLFQKNDILTQEDILKYQQKTEDQDFYLLREDFKAAIRENARKMEEIANAEPPPSREESVKAVENSLEIVKDLVSRSGFTPEAQSIAKSSVSLTLKFIGSKPRLMNILSDLKKKQGNYITSHSVMLGQIACALAHKMGWNSAATYFKLSLAAFIHDIALPNSELASVDSLTAAKASKKFHETDLQSIRIHPLKAAEYALRFNEIPPDVDQIVNQHHERPDGTGFPRGLSAKQISPLAALFIIAHEMIDYSLQFPDLPMNTYFEKNAATHSAGAFKKIFQAFKGEKELD